MRPTNTRPADLQPVPSHIIGPTWQRHEDGRYWLPDKTLGWDIINWLYTYVRQPDGPHAGEPFIPTGEQARFIVWWYAVDDEGRFSYRSGVLRRLKGWGKDPLVAALSLAELCGPVAFSHMDPVTGSPAGKTRSAAWVQVAAVSQDQTRNTFALFPAMVTEKLQEEFGVEVNRTIIYTKSGGMIESVTSSPMALEGKRPTFVILNEVQWWIEANSGHDMYNVIEGNVTKSSGGTSRYLAICNAHRPGEDSIGERLWDSFQAVESGQAVDTGLIYDALEAPADTPISEIPPKDTDPDGFEDGVKRLREGLLVARGDAVWLDPETIIASIMDINNLVSESRRKFLNQINATEDSWISPPEWDRAWSDVRLEQNDKVALAFDGSKSGDWSALVACRIEDSAIIPIKVWNPEKYGGEIPRDDVDALVHWAFSRYNVVAFRADVKEFEAYVDQWTSKYRKRLKIDAIQGKPIAFDMRGKDTSMVRKRFALDCERFLDALLEGEITHDGDKTLRQHILNAHRHPTEYDSVTIRKASKDSSRKIDAAVTAVMAFGARQDYIMSKKHRGGRAVVLR